MKPVRPTDSGDDRLKEAIVQAIRGTRDLFRGMANAVAELFSGAPGDFDGPDDSMTERVRTIAENAVRGAVESGSDISVGAKGILVGVLRGTQTSGDAARKVAGQTVQTVIRQTAWTGANLADAARGLVEGATVAAKELGLDAAEAASSAAQAAVDAAEDFGTEAVRNVRDSVTETIVGLIGVPTESFKNPCL